MSMPRVQVVLGGSQVPDTLHGALRRVGASATFEPLAQAVRTGLDTSADAVVFVDDAAARPDNLTTLMHRLADQPQGALVLQSDGGPRLPTFPAAAPISFGAALSEDELAARLTTLIDLRRPLASIVQRRRQDEAAAERISESYQEQMRQAAQMQRELLPTSVPSYPPYYFRLIHRPAREVSGDVVTVQTLSEDYVAFGLADATGCGMSAALLTILIKRGFRGRERVGGKQCILTPDQVLANLNDELLEADLSECPFVAAVYGLLNRQTGTLVMARAGAPYPLLRQRDGLVRELCPGGCVLGVTPDAEFPVEIVQLAEGESLILWSDGVESVFHRSGAASSAAQGRTPATLDEWTAQFSSEGLGAALDTVSTRQELLRRLGRSTDDLTILSLEHQFAGA